MGKSLKDALLNAGLKSTNSENERKKQRPQRRPGGGQSTAKKQETKSIRHQEQRNFCEVCQGYQPDVELYKHRNPTVQGNWICVNCADKSEISDDFRVTAQSDFSQKDQFRRFFGHTKRMPKEMMPAKKDPKKEMAKKVFHKKEEKKEEAPEKKEVHKKRPFKKRYTGPGAIHGEVPRDKRNRNR